MWKILLGMAVTSLRDTDEAGGPLSDWAHNAESKSGNGYYDAFHGQHGVVHLKLPLGKHRGVVVCALGSYPIVQ